MREQAVPDAKPLPFQFITHANPQWRKKNVGRRTGFDVSELHGDVYRIVTQTHGRVICLFSWQPLDKISAFWQLRQLRRDMKNIVIRHDDSQRCVAYRLFALVKDDELQIVSVFLE